MTRNCLADMHLRDDLALKRGIKRFADCESSSAKSEQGNDGHSGAFDHLKPIDAHNKLLCKSRSESDLINPENSIFPSILKPLAFLWRRSAQNQISSQSFMAPSGNSVQLPVEDIKQRWRSQQIATQERLAREKCFFWGGGTRSLRGSSRNMFHR